MPGSAPVGQVAATSVMEVVTGHNWVEQVAVNPTPAA
jgi:hypothetical protein